MAADDPRWRRPGRTVGSDTPQGEWARRLGALPPKRMIASWSGSSTGSNRIQGRGASVARDGGLPSDLLNGATEASDYLKTKEVRNGRSQEAGWLDKQIPIQAPSMGKPIINLSSVTIVELDLAKRVFQIDGVDASGRVVVAKPIRRNKLLEFFASLPPCLVGLEACGSAHHWARELIKLGHDARMMPPAYVKPYIRRQKNDAADAAAIS